MCSNHSRKQEKGKNTKQTSTNLKAPPPYERDINSQENTNIMVLIDLDDRFYPNLSGYNILADQWKHTSLFYYLKILTPPPPRGGGGRSAAPYRSAIPCDKFSGCLSTTSH